MNDDENYRTKKGSVLGMASEEWVTEAQARELARKYGASPDEIEREIARDYRGATWYWSPVRRSLVSVYDGQTTVQDLSERNPEHTEVALATEESVPEELARGGDPILAAKTEAWMAAEAAAIERWLTAEQPHPRGAFAAAAVADDPPHDPSLVAKTEEWMAAEAARMDQWLTANAPDEHAYSPQERAAHADNAPDEDADTRPEETGDSTNDYRGDVDFGSRREKHGPPTRSPGPTRPSPTPNGCTPSGPSRGRLPTGWLPTITPGLSVTRSSSAARTKRSHPPKSGDENPSPITHCHPPAGRVRTTKEAPDGTEH